MTRVNPAEVLQTEFSEPFVEGMRNRMVVSFFKYGPVAKATQVDKLASLEKRLAMYRETGNTEWLMDAANFAMIEYMHPQHPNAHFRGTDAKESPGRIDGYGAATQARNDAVDGPPRCPKCESSATKGPSGWRCTSPFCMYVWER